MKPHLYNFNFKQTRSITLAYTVFKKSYPRKIKILIFGNVYKVTINYENNCLKINHIITK